MQTRGAIVSRGRRDGNSCCSADEAFSGGFRYTDGVMSVIKDVSEIAKGTKLAALLPGDTQLWTVYASAIPASSKEPAHARAFINALTSPAMAHRWTTGGFEPLK